jgi:acyl-CoA reductase-like NAD-dependent aldehyde dehydrogenase
VITAAHRDRVQGFVDDAVAGGAEVLASGTAPEGPGWWAPPTLLGSVDPAARAVRDEIFGPVGIVQPYDSVEDAVRIANDTAYGLAANVYAADLDEARRVAARLRAGLVTVNGGGALRPDGVFGGFKASGVGREHGEWGIREYLEPQHVQWLLPEGVPA